MDRVGEANQREGARGNRCVAFRVALAGLLLQFSAHLPAQTTMAAAIARRGGLDVRVEPSSSPVMPPATLEDALHDAFQQADIVFTGEVLSIERADDAVVIGWQVEDAVRGAHAGGVFVLREWSGLWDSNGARYTVGQRALVMLHAPSAAGYSSPVGDGVVALHGHLQDGFLDLRLLAQHVAVTDTARLRPARMLKLAGGSFDLSSALQARASAAVEPSQIPKAAPHMRAPEDDTTAIGAGSDASTVMPTSTSKGSDPNSRLDAGLVLGMLHAWQQGRPVAK